MAFELWRPGMRITAARLNASTPGEWKSWTPIWSTTGGPGGQDFGNATVNCRYTVAGRSCYFAMAIQFGSTTSFGDSTNWTFSLPVTAASSDLPLGYASLFTGDAGPSTSMASSALAHLQTVDTLVLYLQSRSVGNVSPSTGIVDSMAPFTWAAGHEVHLNGTYETAA